MADHIYVEKVLTWLEESWVDGYGTGAYGIGPYGGLDTPAFVDGDDGESTEYDGREINYDLSKSNAVIVDSSPNRSSSFMGSNANYEFEDAVSIEIAAMPSSVVDFGGGVGVEDAAEFRQLYRTVRAIVNANRNWPDPDGNQVAYSMGIFDESNLSSEYGDLFLYDMTVTVEGFEILG